MQDKHSHQFNHTGVRAVSEFLQVGLLGNVEYLLHFLNSWALALNKPLTRPRTFLFPEASLIHAAIKIVLYMMHTCIWYLCTCAQAQPECVGSSYYSTILCVHDIVMKIILTLQM